MNKELLEQNGLILMGGVSGEGRSHYKEMWKLQALQRTVNILIFDRGNFQDVVKPSNSDKNIESCKNIEFDIVNMFELPDDELQIEKEYLGKNVWLKI